MEVRGIDNLLITVYYRAAGRDWLVTGQFGEGSGLDSQDVRDFFALVKSIRHETSVAVAPTATLWPTPTPEPPISPAWLDPEAAIFAAAQDLGWQRGSPGWSHANEEAEQAYLIRNLYALVTVPVGEYNTDTEGFYRWLQDYLASWFLPYSETELTSWDEQARLQVLAALEDPASPIARQLREIAAGADPLRPGSDSQAYWDYLVGPYWEVHRHLIVPPYDEAFVRQFDETMNEYRAAQLKDPAAIPDFATFLSNSDFIDYWVR